MSEGERRSAESGQITQPLVPRKPLYLRAEAEERAFEQASAKKEEERRAARKGTANESNHAPTMQPENIT